MHARHVNVAVGRVIDSDGLTGADVLHPDAPASRGPLKGAAALEPGNVNVHFALVTEYQDCNHDDDRDYADDDHFRSHSGSFLGRERHER